MKLTPDCRMDTVRPYKNRAVINVGGSRSDVMDCCGHPVCALFERSQSGSGPYVMRSDPVSNRRQQDHLQSPAMDRALRPSVTSFQPSGFCIYFLAELVEVLLKS